MPNSNPEGYRQISQSSLLSPLEIEVLNGAASVHASALQFCRMDFEDFKRRDKTPEKASREEIASSVRDLAMASALCQAVHVFLLEPNSEDHLNQVLAALKEIATEGFSDLFFEKANAFGQQLSDLAMQRRAKAQAERLSKN